MLTVLKHRMILDLKEKFQTPLSNNLKTRNMKTSAKTVNEEIKEILYTQKNTYSVAKVNDVKNDGTKAFIFTVVVAFVVTAVLTHFGIISVY